MRYLQRDGTTREGERGALYSADQDRTEGKAFVERGAGDRHQFRFIIAPEDGSEYDDLKPLVRRFMRQVEQDLGTRLDWVAVDHFNTGHPHSHVIVRGKDELGKDLVIARDYMSEGLRHRAAEIVNLDLGPRSDREIRKSQLREVEQERFTGIDRRLIRSAGPDGLLASSRISDWPRRRARGAGGSIPTLSRSSGAWASGATSSGPSTENWGSPSSTARPRTMRSMIHIARGPGRWSVG
jgi:type IV secretory pathway VirD2 relaxase